MESEASIGGTDILDLLFDDCGVLKTDDDDNMMKINDSLDNGKKSYSYNSYATDISSVNFGDFDLTDNLFESLLNQAEPNSFFEEESSAKCNSIHTDHTYIAHKSPSEHSDSGISVVSDDSNGAPATNMTDDQLEKMNRSQNHQAYDAMDTSPSSDSYIFDLIGLNEGNEITDGSYDSRNLSVKSSGDYGDDYELSPDINDDEFSIDFDFADLDFSSSLNSKGTQSILLVDGATKKIIPIKKTNKDCHSLPFTVKDIDPHITNTIDFPELRLTDEEKELLTREGITLPSHLPLTRDEERVLKSVRRKIRNKVSAKESRKRKQTYVDGLEHRVKLCTAENRELQKKVNNLEKQNVTLVGQLKRLQSLVGRSKGSAHASTCVMVLLLSFALFVIPTFDPFGSNDNNENHSPVSMSSQSVRGKARSLLVAENSKEMSDSDEDPYGVTSRPSAPWDQIVMPMSTAQKVMESPDDEMESDLNAKETIDDNGLKETADVGDVGNDLKFVSENVINDDNATSDDQKSTNFHNIDQKQEV